MKNISKEEWKALIENTENKVVLDVRTAQECSEGIQPNALQLDFLSSSEFLSGVQELDKSKTFFVYCRSGNRSSQACQVLERFGVRDTYNLLGGMMAWDGELIK